MWLNSDKVAVQTPHLHSNHRGINVRGKKILIQQNLSPTFKAETWTFISVISRVS